MRKLTNPLDSLIITIFGNASQTFENGFSKTAIFRFTNADQVVYVVEIPPNPTPNALTLNV
jgi:hypothetical protein